MERAADRAALVLFRPDRNPRLVLRRADGQRRLDARHVGGGGQMGRQNILERFEVAGDDLQDEVDFAV